MTELDQSQGKVRIGPHENAGPWHPDEEVLDLLLHPLPMSHVGRYVAAQRYQPRGLTHKYIPIPKIALSGSLHTKNNARALQHPP